jgi:3-deoxy-manno-octulosonate cytidylyltransferase (CMP-KDO synthetase)
MLEHQKITGIIPARYASTRFPGKPLAMLGEKPMVQWVYEGCTGVFDHIAVATDDHRIADVVEAFGGHCIMTSPDHRTGTERCLEAVRLMEQSQGIQSDIVVNIQGDEPFIRREQLTELLGCFENKSVEIGTLRRELSPDDDPGDPNIVKLVTDHAGRVLYFSRSPIPYFRDGQQLQPDQYMKHIGLYAFRADTLEEICQLPPSPLEQAESLEQLRWMENGYEIYSRATAYISAGVDTPGDLEKLRARIR